MKIDTYFLISLNQFFVFYFLFSLYATKKESDLVINMKMISVVKKQKKTKNKTKKKKGKKKNLFEMSSDN